MMRALVLAALIAAAGAAPAQQAAPDPTRPPGYGPSDAAGGEAPMVLQSVILPKRGKPSAIIGGERLTLGGKLGEAQVVKITESEVVLKGPEGLQTLKMAPDVEKKPSSAQDKGRRKPARLGGGNK